MLRTLKQIIIDWNTENDGKSWCPARTLTQAAAMVMIYRFAVDAAPNYVSFATGFAALVGAIAANKWTERKELEDDKHS